MTNTFNPEITTGLVSSEPSETSRTALQPATEGTHTWSSTPHTCALDSCSSQARFFEELHNQLENDDWDYAKVSETEYRTFGDLRGYGYVEILIVAHPERATCTFSIRTGIMVPPNRQTAVRQFLRRKDHELIVTGLRLSDEGEFVFIPDFETYLLEGENIAIDTGRACSTIHGIAGDIIAIICGIDPWNVLEERKKKPSAAELARFLATTED